MDVKDTLLAYSEWLDGEHLIVGTEGELRPIVATDTRTHAELVDAFVEHWHEHDDTPCMKRAPLAGEGPVLTVVSADG